MIKLDTKILYFGNSNPNIKEISEGKFLTSFKSIAYCFAIDLNDVYGELNKKYTSINWGYDQWNKSENYLNKQLIPEKIKIINNAKEWIKTTGTSIGYLYSVNVDDYILTHIETLKELYPKLLEDPVHKWRAKNGIELIHKEPDFQEQKRIFYNWLAMPKSLQEKSDNKSKQLFSGMTNLEHHNAIMEYEWHDENYFELADIRQRYDKRDMEENGLKYIHISLSNKPITFTPRVPKNVFELKGSFKQYSEDKTIPRICCSDSIFGAISAIKIDTTKTYYVHLLQPKKIMNNKEVSQYVPDAIAIGECWILDDEIKSTVIGKIEIGSLLPYVYTFLKDNNKFFRCVTYHDYDFIPFESKFNRIYRKILNQK